MAILARLCHLNPRALGFYGNVLYRKPMCRTFLSLAILKNNDSIHKVKHYFNFELQLALTDDRWQSRRYRESIRL